MTDRSLEQIEILNDEIADVDAQLASGDLDAETADRLRRRYAEELEVLIAARSSGEAATEPEPVVRRRLSGRALVGAAIVAVAATVIAVFAITSLRDGGSSGIEGVASDAIGGEGRDLSTVSNEEMEAVIAENPEVVPMRLALARRYFEAGEFDKALDHYFEVLDREQHPEALANVGWMTYLSGHPDVAVNYVEAAVERDATFLTAKWFLGNIYATLGRTDEAIVQLTIVANDANTPDDVKAAAIELIRQMDAS